MTDVTPAAAAAEGQFWESITRGCNSMGRSVAVVATADSSGCVVPSVHTASSACRAPKVFVHRVFVQAFCGSYRVVACGACCSKLSFEGAVRCLSDVLCGQFLRTWRSELCLGFLRSCQQKHCDTWSGPGLLLKLSLAPGPWLGAGTVS